MACKLLVAACVWDLVSCPGIEPGPPALGVHSLNHCATREVPKTLFLKTLEFHRLLLCRVKALPNSNTRGSEGLSQLMAQFNDTEVNMCSVKGGLLCFLK